MKCVRDIRRSALTLVELLVVVTIMVLLLGVVLPLAGPALRGREVREAARQVSAFLASAQADAIATGRAVGVELSPSADLTQCFRLYKVKEPPAYSDPAVRAILTNPVPGPNSVTASLALTGGAVDPMLTLRSLLTDRTELGVPVNQLPPIGFAVQFDYRGPRYLGRWVRTSNEFIVEFPRLPLPPNATAAGPGARCTIYLPPRRSLSAPLRLPVGAYIDLAASGFAWTQPASTNVPSDAAAFEGSLFHQSFLATATKPLSPARIMYGPSGELLSFWGEIAFPGGGADTEDALKARGPVLPFNPIALLLTNSKRGPGELANRLRPDETGIWVTVAPSGKVTTSANLGSVAGNYRDALHEARSTFRTSAGMGGR